jgi:hypothetical protein
MRAAKLPDGPPAHLLTGPVTDLHHDRLGCFTRWARDYGDFVPLRLGPRRGFLLSHPRWLWQRRLAQPAFDHRHVNAYAEAMVDCTERMLARWHDGERRDIHAEMMERLRDPRGDPPARLDRPTVPPGARAGPPDRPPAAHDPPPQAWHADVAARTDPRPPRHCAACGVGSAVPTCSARQADRVGKDGRMVLIEGRAP